MFQAPIRMPSAVNHNLVDRSASFYTTRVSAIARANWALVQKLRLAYRIPYHEWQEALKRARFNGSGDCPCWRHGPVEDLLEAYTPRFNSVTRVIFDGPRCPPWASRRYRAACAAAMPLRAS